MTASKIVTFEIFLLQKMKVTLREDDLNEKKLPSPLLGRPLRN